MGSLEGEMVRKEAKMRRKNLETRKPGGKDEMVNDEESVDWKICLPLDIIIDFL